MCQAAFSYCKQILDYIHTSIQHDISSHCKKRLDYVDTLICHDVFSHFKKTCYAALITIKRALAIFIRLCTMFGFYNRRNGRNGIPCLVSYSLDIGALPITSSKYYDISTLGTRVKRHG